MREIHNHILSSISFFFFPSLRSTSHEIHTNIYIYLYIIYIFYLFRCIFLTIQPPRYRSNYRRQTAQKLFRSTICEKASAPPTEQRRRFCINPGVSTRRQDPQKTSPEENIFLRAISTKTETGSEKNLRWNSSHWGPSTRHKPRQKISPWHPVKSAKLQKRREETGLKSNRRHIHTGVLKENKGQFAPGNRVASPFHALLCFHSKA